MGFLKDLNVGDESKTPVPTPASQDDQELLELINKLRVNIKIVGCAIQ